MMALSEPAVGIARERGVIPGDAHDVGLEAAEQKVELVTGEFTPSCLDDDSSLDQGYDRDAHGLRRVESSREPRRDGFIL